MFKTRAGTDPRLANVGEPRRHGAVGLGIVGQALFQLAGPLSAPTFVSIDGAPRIRHTMHRIRFLIDWGTSYGRIGLGAFVWHAAHSSHPPDRPGGGA